MLLASGLWLLVAPARGLELSAAPDGGVEVIRDRPRVAERYDREGRLLGTSVAPPVSTAALAVDGPRQLELAPGLLSVTGGPTPCTLPVTPPAVPRDRSLGFDDGPVQRSSAPTPPTVGALSARWAALSGVNGLILVDVARCAVVAARERDELPRVEALAFDGDELLVLSEGARDGVGLTRWSLPDLRPRGGFTTASPFVLPTPEGPALLYVGDRWTPSRLVDAAGIHPLPGLLQREGEQLVGLRPDGSAALYDLHGRLLSETAPATLAALAQTDRGEGELWVSDGVDIVHLPGGEVQPAPWVGQSGLRGVVPTPPANRDEPDRRDALAALPVLPAAEPAIDGGGSGPWQLRRRGEQVVLTGRGREWGVPLPGHTVAVSPDGRVAFAWTPDHALEALRVADGARIWSLPGAAPGAVVAGADWLALDGAGWRFLDPADGHLLASLDHTGALVRGGARLTFDPASLHGAAWQAPEPSSRPYLPTATPEAVVRPLEPACADPEAALAPLAASPELQVRERERLRQRCAPPRPRPYLPWPTSAEAAPGGWSLRAPPEVRELYALAGGRVYLRTADRQGVYEADGRLAWSDAAPGGVVVGPDRVYELTKGRVRCRDAATGATLWVRAGSIEPDGSFRATAAAPPEALPVLGPTRDRGRLAWSWGCGPGGCVPRPDGGARWVIGLDLGAARVRLEDGRLLFDGPAGRPRSRRGWDRLAPAPEGFLARRRRDDRWFRFDAAGRRVERLEVAGWLVTDGRVRWLVESGRLVALGAGPPAPPSAAEPGPSPPATSPPAATPTSSTAPSPPTAVPVTLTDGLDGAEGRRGAELVWSAPGCRRLGVVDGVAILRAADGRYEGRRTSDGAPLWRSALTGPVRVDRGGLLAGYNPTTLLDEHLGTPLTTWTSPPQAVGRGGAHTALALSDTRDRRVVDPEGRRLATPSRDVEALLYVGDTLLVLEKEGPVSAWRDGVMLWTLSGVVYELRSDELGLRARRGDLWLDLDPETGRVLSAVPVPRPR